MSDPTALDVALAALGGGPDPDQKEEWWCTPRDLVTAVIDALGIDHDAPLSLLRWHATTAERERCAAIAREIDTEDPCPQSFAILSRLEGADDE